MYMVSRRHKGEQCPYYVSHNGNDPKKSTGGGAKKKKKPRFPKEKKNERIIQPSGWKARPFLNVDQSYPGRSRLYLAQLRQYKKNNSRLRPRISDVGKKGRAMRGAPPCSVNAVMTSGQEKRKQNIQVLGRDRAATIKKKPDFLIAIKKDPPPPPPPQKKKRNASLRKRFAIGRTGSNVEVFLPRGKASPFRQPKYTHL